MSARALNVYESLLADGVDQVRARRAAENIDKNDVRADSAAGRFVTKDEYGRRMENTPDRAEMDGKFGRLMDEIARLSSRMDRFDERMDSHYRILVVMLVSVVGGCAGVIAAAIKIIFFGG